MYSIEQSRGPSKGRWRKRKSRKAAGGEEGLLPEAEEGVRKASRPIFQESGPQAPSLSSFPSIIFSPPIHPPFLTPPPFASSDSKGLSRVDSQPIQSILSVNMEKSIVLDRVVPVAGDGGPLFNVACRYPRPLRGWISRFTLCRWSTGLRIGDGSFGH